MTKKTEKVTAKKTPPKPKPSILENPGKMKVRIEFTEELLGTASGNPEIHEEFIASKSADKDLVKEELKALDAGELMEKSTTIFPRDENDDPVLWDYQVKGFLKEAIGALVEFEAVELKSGVKLSKYTNKRVTDNFIFVFPRQIPLVLPDSSSGIGSCTRSLRAVTQRGERIALATSETVPAGTVIEIEIRWLHKKLEKYVREALDYGELKGIGQWRNSGKGRFKWSEVV